MITDSEMDLLGTAEVKHRLERGDYLGSDLRAVNSWLKRRKKEAEFIERCRKADISASLRAHQIATRSNWIAGIALAVALFSVRYDIVDMVQVVRSSLVAL